MKLEKLVRNNIWNLTPYSSAREDFTAAAKIQLDANENGIETGLNRYPDPYQVELKSVLAGLKSVTEDNLIIGNGSDELIDLLIRTFCEPKIDNIISVVPSYGMYKVSAAINEVEVIQVPLSDNFDLNADKVISAIAENTKMIFLCSPNNPTGNILNVAEIERILKRFNGIMVIDEAYIEFSTSVSWSKRLNEFPQLIVLQTLSKYYGLAGLRIGIGISSPQIINLLNKVKPPYNVSVLSQKEATRMLKANKSGGFEDRIRTEREKLSTFLSNSALVTKVFPSETNFLLIQFTNAQVVFDRLKNEGIIVRNRSNEYGCSNCLRITIGTSRENEQLMSLLKNIE